MLYQLSYASYDYLVGVARLELATSGSRSRRSTKLSYAPKGGRCSRTRTCDFGVPNAALYQAELCTGLVVTEGVEPSTAAL